MDCVRFASFAVVTVLAPFLTVSPAQARAAQPTGGAAAPATDTRELDRTAFTLDGRPLPAKPRYRQDPRREPADQTRRPRPSESRKPTAGTPATGTVREWLGMDDTTGKYYRKSY